MFGVRTVADYLVLCDQAVEELRAEQANVLRGFAAVLLLNHIPDWLQYKFCIDQRMALGLNGGRGDPLYDTFASRFSDLSVIRDLANGFKHLRPVNPTEVAGKYGTGRYGVGRYGVPYLLVDRGESVEGASRWTDCHSLCSGVLTWWHTQLDPVIENEGGSTGCATSHS